MCADFSKQLDVLSKKNRDELKKMKAESLKKLGQEKQQEHITKALAEKEIEYLKATVVNLEVKQLAES